MSAAESTTTTNSLGLAFEQANASDAAPVEAEADSQPVKDGKDKKKPYIREAAAPREKLSEQELSDRMARIREQNEKIKQRRLDVQADEQAFRQMQEAEKAQQARNRKIQDGVDKTRQQNAERKMAKIQNREWDSGKPQGPNSSKSGDKESGDSPSSTQQSWSRGGRSRGRGRGGGGRGGSRGGAASRQEPPQEPATDTGPSPPTAKEAPTSPPEPASNDTKTD